MTVAANDFQVVADVMTPYPEVVSPRDRVNVAARRMRDAGVGSIIVAYENEVIGILTDRDIVVRLVAEGRDTAEARVGDICSDIDLAVLGPDDSLSEAITLIRSKAVRRIPVVDGGRPVGIVSLGDLALMRDPTSVLADVSAAPPNT